MIFGNKKTKRQLITFQLAGLYLLLVVFIMPSYADDTVFSLFSVSDAARQRGAVSGNFIQCTRHGSVVVMSTGTFTVNSKGGLVWNINSPVRQTIEIMPGGPVRSNGDSQKVKTFNYLGKVVLPLIQLDPVDIKRLFKVNLTGDISSYRIELEPKRRLSKKIRRIIMDGNHGMIKLIDIMISPNRQAVIRLYSDKEKAEENCSVKS